MEDKLFGFPKMSINKPKSLDSRLTFSWNNLFEQKKKKINTQISGLLGPPIEFFIG